MMVKMLVDTVFEGKTLKIGGAVEQPDKVAERWIKNGIATLEKPIIILTEEEKQKKIDDLKAKLAKSVTDGKLTQEAADKAFEAGVKKINKD